MSISCSEIKVSILASKRRKSGLFRPCIEALISAGGGDPTDLSCLGEPNTQETKSLQNLAVLLGRCEQQIEMSCTSAHVQQIDLTQVSLCKQTMRKFKTRVKSCMLKTGCEACQCWRNPRLTSEAEVIKSCTLKTESKLTAVDNKYCRGNFSACRRYEDKSIGAVAACGRTTESLLLTAKMLKYNFAILGNVMDRAHRVLGPRIADNLTLSCAEVLKTNEKLMDFVIKNPLAILDLESIEDESLVTSSII